MDSKTTASLIAVAVTVLASGVIFNSHLNIEFTLILPDGNQTNGIVSSDNFTRIQQNVGVFTITQSSLFNTQNKPTTGYCELAKFIHEHEDGYNNLHVGNGTIFTATIPPKYCDAQSKTIHLTDNVKLDNSTVNATVPEFPQTSLLIMIISITSIIALTRFRKKLS